MANFRDGTARWLFFKSACMGCCFIFLNRALFFDLESSFIMSIVSCDDPVPPCPDGSAQLGDSCVAHPPGSSEWSFSTHCMVREQVLNSARETISSLSAADGFGSVLALFVLGPMVDSWGRKPMLLVALIGTLIRALMQYGSSILVGRTSAQDWINIAAAFVACALNVFKPAIMAMAADLSESQIDRRNWALSVMNQALFLAGPLGFGGGFWILHASLESYSWVWVASALANVLLFLATLLLLSETKHLYDTRTKTLQVVDLQIVPEANKQEPETCRSKDGQQRKGRSCGALRDTVGFVRDVVRVPVLRQVLILIFVLKLQWSMGHLGRWLLMTYLGYSQAAASMVGFTSTLLGVVGSRVNALLVPRIGSWNTLLVALLLCSMGSILEGVSVLLASQMNPLVVPSILFWTGRVILSMGHGIYTPLLDAIASVHMGSEQQGRLFSVLKLTALVGRILGMSLLFRRGFNSSWTGWMAPLSCWVGGAVYALGSCWVFILPRWRRVFGTTVDSSDKSSTDGATA